MALDDSLEQEQIEKIEKIEEEEETVRVYMCPICGHIGVWESVHHKSCTCENQDVDWMVIGVAILRYDLEEIKTKLDKLEARSNKPKDSGGDKYATEEDSMD